MHSLLSSWDMRNKRVLIRADLNVPLHDGIILDDFRLRETMPTIEYVTRAGGKPIIITHLGQPKGTDFAYSTRHLIAWFEHQGHKVHWAPTIQDAYNASQTLDTTLVLLENLRFFPGEKSKDTAFARELSSLGDYFMQDAFGTLHRDDSSISLVPHFFAPHMRTIGLCVQRELEHLEPLNSNPARPYMVIIGGSKVSDKLKLIEAFAHKADTLVLCPALIFTFMKAQGKKVGISLVDDVLIDTCRMLMEQQQKNHAHYFEPIDFLVGMHGPEGALEVRTANDLRETDFGIAFGPQSTAKLSQLIAQAGSVLFNGAMGFATRPETRASTFAILDAMAVSPAYTCVAGGDAVAAVHTCKLADRLSYLSTGGGATLTYLAGMPLAGLHALQSDS